MDTQPENPSGSSRLEHRSGQQPKGWTQEMTATVMDSLRQGDDGVLIEETIKALYDFQEDRLGGLEAWLEVLRSEFEAGEGDPMS